MINQGTQTAVGKSTRISPEKQAEVVVKAPNNDAPPAAKGGATEGLGPALALGGVIGGTGAVGQVAAAVINAKTQKDMLKDNHKHEEKLANTTANQATVPELLPFIGVISTSSSTTHTTTTIATPSHVQLNQFKGAWEDKEELLIYKVIIIAIVIIVVVSGIICCCCICVYMKNKGNIAVNAGNSGESRNFQGTGFYPGGKPPMGV